MLLCCQFLFVNSNAKLKTQKVFLSKKNNNTTIIITSGAYPRKGTDLPKRHIATAQITLQDFNKFPPAPLSVPGKR